MIDTCDGLQGLPVEPISDGTALVSAERLRPMIGICDAVWHQTLRHMDMIAAADAATVDQIRTPAAYLGIFQ